MERKAGKFFKAYGFVSSLREASDEYLLKFEEYV
jgi:hypothetical protein